MATDHSMSWRSLTIDEALDKVAEPLIERGLATKDRGVSEKAIDAADKRLGHRLPDELRAFYRRVTPVSQCPDFGFGSVGFQPVSGPELTSLDDPQLRAEKLWVASKAFPRSPRSGIWIFTICMAAPYVSRLLATVTT